MNNTIFLAIEKEILEICVSKDNLLLSVTPRSIRDLDTSRLSPHEVKGGWDGQGVIDQLIVIECVLRVLSFIPHVEHHDWILAKSLFKELATSLNSEGDAYEKILFSRSFHISAV